jgi:hypothetical protein
MTLLLGGYHYATTPPSTQYLPTYPGAVQISDTMTGDARSFTREWILRSPDSLDMVRTFYRDSLEHDRWQTPLDYRRNHSHTLLYHWLSSQGPYYSLIVALTTVEDKTVIHIKLIKQPYLTY